MKKCVAALKALAMRRATARATSLTLSIEATRARATVGDLLGAGRRLWPLPGHHPLHRRRLCQRVGGRPGAGAHPHRDRVLRRGRRPPAASDGREDGPGRPRPRRQGDCHGVRRLGLRRRYRPAVPDAGGSRARGHRERCACDRRVEPGGRPQDWCRSSSRSSPSRAARKCWSGGVIFAQDYDFLKKAGVAAIYGLGTNILAAAAEILSILRQRGQKRAA